MFGLDGLTWALIGAVVLLTISSAWWASVAREWRTVAEGRRRGFIGMVDGSLQITDIDFENVGDGTPEGIGTALYNALIGGYEGRLRDAEHRAGIAQRNLAFERHARSVDRTAYQELAREQGRALGHATIALESANRELNGVLDLLVGRGLVPAPDEGEAVDLVLLVQAVIEAIAPYGSLPSDEEPRLGFATTRELLGELTARAEVNGHADYSTVGDERVHPACKSEGVEAIRARGRSLDRD